VPEISLVPLLNLPFVLVIAIFGVAFAATDRFNGGGLGWDKLTKDHGGPLGGRGIYYAALPLGILTYVLGGLPALLGAIVWGIYRSAFGNPTGTLTGRNLPRTLLRHALVLPPLFLLNRHFGQPLFVLVPFLAYVAVAVVLAYWHGEEAAQGHDENATVEFLRGAFFGVALAGTIGIA
jgi:hypothetical protein